jgi:HEAT repeat protein
VRSAPRRSVALALLAALALPGFDWPGRAATLSSQLDGAAPERRREILLEAASARDPAARALVLRCLADESATVRVAAAAVAARLHVTEAAPTLVTWLDRPEAEARLAAPEALGALRVEATFAPLQRVLSDADTHVRLAAVRAAVAVAGRGATVALLDRVSDGESVVRVEAVRALGDLGDARAVLPLLGSLQDAIPEVRAAGAHALGAIGDPRGQRALVAAFHDAAAEVRHAAVRAVGALGSRAPGAVADLAAVALRESRDGEPAAWSRLAVVAIQALRSVGSPAAVDVLVEVARRAGEFVDREPAREALRALGAMGDVGRSRIPALVASVPADLEAELLTLLGALGGDEAARALLRRLDRPNLSPGSRSLVLMALGETGSREALLPLLSLAVAAPAPLAPRTFARTGECAAPRLDQAALDGLGALADRSGTLGPESLDLLVALRDRAAGGCERQSVAVIELLGRTGNARAAAAIAPTLRASSATLRVTAARALATTELTGVEGDLAASLRDSAPAVRLAAADALARRATASSLPALLDRWDAPEPIDRGALARALARTARRGADVALRTRIATSLTGCARTAAPELAASCLDGLADLAAVDTPGAREALVEAATGPRVVLRAAAADALAAAVALAPVESRGPLLALVASSSARASAVWAMGEGGEAQVGPLVAALADLDFAVVANASASLGRLGARGVNVDAGDALCATLQAWRHPLVVANTLRALASVRGGACVSAAVERALGHHPEALVREAALAVARARREGSGDDRAVYVAAIAHCAQSDPSSALAEACRRDTSPTEASERGETVDAQVVDAAGEPMERTRYGLVLPDRWIRVGTTGPGGWVHARPTTAGRFLVVAPYDLAADAP